MGDNAFKFMDGTEGLIGQVLTQYWSLHSVRNLLHLRGLREGVCVHFSRIEGTLREGARIEDLMDELRQVHGATFVQTIHSKSSQETAGTAHDQVTSFNAAWDACVVDFDILPSSVKFTVSTFDKKHMESLLECAGRYIGPIRSAGRVYVIATSSVGPILAEVGAAGSPLEETNYEPRVLEDYRHVVADLNSKSPCGRIVLLDGPPGTGKTYLTRALMDRVPDAIFVVVQPGMVDQLADPSLVSVLLKTKENRDGFGPVVLIVEDADHCLVKRDQNNVNPLSAVLNLSDGLLGSLIDIRLICTTNAEIGRLDEAVTRHGRMCRRIEVGPLGRERAEGVYRRISGQQPPMTLADATLADVYNLAAGGTETGVQPRRPAGFAR